MKAWMLCQPSLRRSVFVGRVVVDDQVQLEVLGRFLVDFFEKGQPFLMPVLALNAADQLALNIIQRSEERNQHTRWGSWRGYHLGRSHRQ